LDWGVLFASAYQAAGEGLERLDHGRLRLSRGSFSAVCEVAPLSSPKTEVKSSFFRRL